ncbi:MAG: hypothetical protein AAF357_14040, partial [Verrucomicrobiota bacterium]
PGHNFLKIAWPIISEQATTDLLGNWKARGCDVEAKDGIITIKRNQPEAFLGVGFGSKGGASIRFRMRSAQAGKGTIECVHPKGESIQLPYELSGMGWQEISIEAPTDATFTILRIHLPKGAQQAYIDWVALAAADRQQRWDF